MVGFPPHFKCGKVLFRAKITINFTEMNGDIFREWVHNRLLPNVPENAVIVIDRASYHLQLRPFNKCASATMKRADLVNWLIDHSVKDAANVLYTAEGLKAFTKMQLVALAQDNKPEKRFLVFDWVKTWNEENNTDIRLNVLPIAHPELNPIEMVWCWLKTWVASNNHDFKMTMIRTLAEQKQAAIGPAEWASSVNKSERTLELYVENDESVAEAMENSESDDDEEEEGSEDDSENNSEEEEEDSSEEEEEEEEEGSGSLW